MELELRVEGDVVERTELLNGTRTVAIEGESGDGTWSISGVVSWNLGLVDYAGEGDLSVSGKDGELFATLTRATPETAGEDEADVQVAVEYEVDGGSGRFEASAGSISGRILVAGDRFEAVWKLHPLT